MILILKAIGWGMAIITIAFLWLSSINLTKPFYNHNHHVWEEDPQARLLSNVAIALMIMLSFFLGYLNG
jgi:hypothetical protein